MSACSAGHDNIARILITEGAADVNLVNDQNRSSLHYACSKGLSNIVKLLIEYGANVHIADEHGNTCLHRYLLISIHSKMSTYLSQ